MINESDFQIQQCVKTYPNYYLNTGILTATGQPVLIKQLKKKLTTKQEKQRYSREVQILRSFNTPYICGIVGFQNNTSTTPVILFNNYINGTLDGAFKNNSIPGPTEALIIASGIASGMRTLHSRNVIHRNLNPSGIFLNEKFEPSIGDFEFSKFTDTSKYQSIIIGTPLWMASELLEASEQYTPAIDVYAYGMILYQLITNQAPYGGNITIGQLFDLLVKNQLPQIPPQVPEIFSNLIKSCLNYNPKQRPSFNDIIEVLSKPDAILPGTDQQKLSEYQHRAFSDIDDLLAKGNLAFANSDKATAIEIYTKAAEKGAAIAYYYLGSIQPEKEIEYFTLAAENGYTEAAIVAGEKLIKSNPDEAFRLFKLAADRGDAAGEFSLGISYAKGIGTEVDQEKAINYLKMAADKGHAGAQYSVGLKLSQTDPDESRRYYEMAADQNHILSIMELAKQSDDQEALILYARASKLGDLLASFKAGEILYRYNRPRDAARFLRLAAEGGHTESQYLCGCILLSGNGVKKDCQKAAVFLKYAADAGNVDACFLCSKLLSEGNGVKKDAKKAMYYFRKAAEGGHDEALFRAGILFSDGEEFLMKSEVKGDTRAMLELGSLCEQRNEYEKAIEHYKKGVEKNDSDCICSLGVLYENGRGTQQDEQEAMNLYRRAALDGSSLGQYNYAVLLQKKGDLEQATKFYKMAADRGDPDAQLSYANLMAPNDINEAAKYAELSADQGNSKAQCLFGQLLYIGRGVQMDKKRAKTYLESSAKQGYERAVKLVRELDFH